MESRRRRAGLVKTRAFYVCAAGLVAALVLAAVPASADAPSPVLEFVPSSGSFPISFVAEGGSVNARLGEFDRILECSGSEGDGEITGPQTTLSSYAFTGCVARPLGGGGGDLKCNSPGADEEEIISETLEADLVYLHQANHEAAMLLNPGGGIYMEFECEGTAIKASGPFLSPVGPINQLADSFTATLSRNGNSQIPSEYEDSNGVVQEAIPMAEVDSEPLDTSGVELGFTVHPSVPLEIKALSVADIEAKQRGEEAAKKRQEEEAAAKKRQEEEAAARKHQDEEAAAKKRQEEEAAALAAKIRQETEAEARKQNLTRALRHCNKVKAKGKRVQCKRRATRKYGPLGAR